MADESRPIIVPWDFSAVAKNAFMHAVNFAKTLSGHIILLHIAHDEKEIEEKQKELSASAAELEKEFSVKPDTVVQAGSIFTAIGEVATESKAQMIIMGTHGVKGSQKLLGSKAVKVVVSSRIPFLIVQDKPEEGKVERILMPIDFKKENKEKANWIYQISTDFHAKVTIFKSNPKDKGFKRKLSSNMKYIENYLKTHDIDYDIVASQGKKSFKEEVVDYAKSESFDMILIMATRDIKWSDYLFGAPEQYIIANEHNIPVMCINPRPMKIAGGFRATGSA